MVFLVRLKNNAVVTSNDMGRGSYREIMLVGDK